MSFLEAAANWADWKSMDVKFARDEMDGWFAIISMSDTKGMFSATVNEIDQRKRTKDKPAETDSEFQERVSAMMSKAVAQTRASRIARDTGRNPMARAA
jgi:hypothetical protein